MRRRDIIAVLTQEEKTALITNTFKLLCNLNVFNDVKGMVAQLKRLLEQLYQDEPEICFEKLSRDYNSPSDSDCIEYCVPCKKVMSIHYFADGKISDGLQKEWLSPWTVSKVTQEKLDIKNAAFRNSYESKQTGVVSQESIQNDIKKRDKDFWDSLLRRRNLFLKYQVCKFLEKKFKVPKRFGSKQRPLWKIAECLKDADTFNFEQQKQIVKAMENVDQAISQLFYNNDYCSRVSLVNFTTQENINEAVKQKSLEYYLRDHNGWLQTKRLWTETYIDLITDPDIKDKTMLRKISNFINLVYSLQCYGEQVKGDIKDFFILIGIMKSQEE